MLRVVVVGGLLVEHRTDALRHAAADLAVDDRRVDDRPAVLDHEVAREADEAGLEVDLDDAGVGGHRPTAVALAAIDDRCAERGVLPLPSTPLPGTVPRSDTADAATSATVSPRDGTPATCTLPSTISMSAGAASSILAAWSTSC